MRPELDPTQFNAEQLTLAYLVGGVLTMLWLGWMTEEPHDDSKTGAALVMGLFWPLTLLAILALMAFLWGRNLGRKAKP